VLPTSISDLIPDQLPIADQQLLERALYGLLFGMLIGVERAVRRKPRDVHPGVIIRTLTFIGLGSTLAVAAFQPPEPEVVAGVLTGIGFIGAGIILRGEGLGHGVAQGQGQVTRQNQDQVTSQDQGQATSQDQGEGQETRRERGLPRRILDAGFAGGRLPRSGTVRISSYFRTL
jgi:hypothetical protein